MSSDKRTKKLGKNFEIENLANNIKLALTSSSIVENTNKIFYEIIRAEKIDIIPELYKLLKEKLLNDKELSTLAETTFELFSKTSPKLYAKDIADRFSDEFKDELKFDKKRKIATLSFNTALDLDVDFSKYSHSRDVIFRESFMISPSGKSLNVAVGLKQWGLNPIALGIVGGDTGFIIKHLLEKKGLTSKYLINGKNDTRINLYGVHVGKSNPIMISTTGKMVFRNELNDLVESANNLLSKGDILVVSGSFAPGITSEFYSNFLKKMKSKEVEIYVDTRVKNFILQTLIDGVTLLGINVFEFANAIGEKPEPIKRNPRKLAKICHKIIESYNTKTLLISMGDNGSVLCCNGRAWHAKPPKIKVLSSIGAGDTLKVGMAYGRIKGMPLLESFRLAVAGSVATTMKKAVGLSTLEEAKSYIDQIEVSEIQ